MPSTIEKSLGVLSALAFVICLSIQPALAGSDPPPPAGATQLTSAEIEKRLIGNTWVYSDNAGGVYFEEGGNADTEWKGKKSKGQWYIEFDEVCVDVADWGGEWCYKFYRVGDSIQTYASTKAKYVDVVVEPGNRL